MCVKKKYSTLPLSQKDGVGFFVVVADFSKVPAAAREEGGVLWVLCL